MGCDSEFYNKINKLTDFISESNSIVFFGGAGVSTESGIPDFRSKDGLYNQHDVEFDMYEPEYLLSEECLHHKPKVFFEFYRQKMDARNVKPNITHYMLARLEKLGKLDKIITQNIDGLHQKAGSSHVIELHGSVLRNYCERCSRFYGIDAIINSKGVPKCSCGGRIKPDVVLYEEGLDEKNIQEAVKLIKEADVLIVGGTSLGVYPAAGLIDYYNGNKLVLINKSETPYDRRADLLIHDALGNVFSQI